MTTEKPALLEHYLDFCWSPLPQRRQEDIEAEFYELLEHPFVKNMAFHKPHVLMIQTDVVEVADPNGVFVIGEFLIYLLREIDHEGYWFCNFYFSNITRPIFNINGDRILSVTHHPHIMSHDDVDDIDQEHIGELCISRGAQIVRQALRLGKIPEVVRKLQIILHATDTGTPFKDPIEWDENRSLVHLVESRPLELLASGIVSGESEDD